MSHLDDMRRKVRPRATNDPAFMAIVEVFAAQIQSLDELLVQLGLLYTLNHSRPPLSMLDSIGALLKVERTPGMSKEQYRTLLRAQIRSRASYGTYDDVKAVANLLRKPGTTAEANVTILYPEALQVAIPNPGAGAKALRALLLGAIQETTSLDLVAVLDPPGDYLILTDPDKGLGKKLAKTL